MSERKSTTAVPEPLEAYAAQFDELFSRVSQREGFRQYMVGLLLPAERNKTLTGLVNAEPIVGAQTARVQSLQWYLSESRWDWVQVNAQRLALLMASESLQPHADGVLVIDETGDRKDGHHTAHVGRQYLANMGKIDHGVVSVSSLWADEEVYYPLEVEPYTPAAWFEGGKAHPHFRTKLKIAAQLVGQAVEKRVPFRAVVADSFYGEDQGFREALDQLGVGYVLALKPSHSWWHHVSQIGSLQDYAHSQEWHSPQNSGQWMSITRTFRDGRREQWWALDVQVAHVYGLECPLRAVVVTTDPLQLPDHQTWYLVTNLPAPQSSRAASSSHAPADLVELVRLYGLRAWVEQSYKQVKYALGWADYQVRSDRAIRRHWALVLCAFTFCWWQARHALTTQPQPDDSTLQPAGVLNAESKKTIAPTHLVLALAPASSPRLARTLHAAQALLGGLLTAAPAATPRRSAPLALDRSSD